MKRILSEFKLYLCNNWINRVPSHRIRLIFYRKIMKFVIEKDCAIFLGCTFNCSGGLHMGHQSVINGSCRIDTRGGIRIGRNVVISQDSTIITADHDMNSNAFEGRLRHVIIEDYVWIGARAMILAGVTIGKGSVVAAGSVVTKNIEECIMVGGVPAKFIKKRKEDLEYKTYYRRLFQ